MLKTAYQLGFQKALEDNHVQQLLKEAQEMGIDVEKLGFLTNLGRGLGQLGRGISAARGAGASGLQALKSGVRSGWNLMSPAQRKTLALTGAGGAAALGGAYGLGRSAATPPPPPQPWYQFGG